jgi:DNA invertase Pin-like site-specific DNA recombinase
MFSVVPKLSGPLIEPAIATDGPLGKMVLTVLGMVAEMELGFIRERSCRHRCRKARGIWAGGTGIPRMLPT